MFHEIYLFSCKAFTVLRLLSAAMLAIPFAAQAQYLMVENLQDELLCRSAVRSCLKPVTCNEGSKSKGSHCWQNQCSFKSHLTVGFRDASSSIKLGDVLKSSVQDPFQLDLNAPVMGSHVLDCKDPAMAKAIIKIQRPELAKPVLAPVIDLSAQR
jgi:hypothetical protein